MENASKALIIAGSVLIAMIVLSILVWGWNRVSSYYKTEENTETVQQIYKKNKELESYNKQLVRGYELRSLYNLMDDMNKRYSEEQGFTKITAKVKLLEEEEIINYFRNIDYKIYETDTPSERNKKTSEINSIISSYVKSKNGSDLATFMTKYYLLPTREKDFLKIFNESYFRCDGVIYNGELEGQDGKGTARVQSFQFTQLKK